jgi:hypothetical protein
LGFVGKVLLEATYALLRVLARQSALNTKRAVKSAHPPYPPNLGDDAAQQESCDQQEYLSNHLKPPPSEDPLSTHQHGNPVT